jgi:conjugal transfer pilus assembly protein TraF
MIMKKQELRVLIGWLMASFPLQADAAFFKDQGRGWHWYEIQEQEVREEHAEEKTPSSKPKAPAEVLKSYRQELEHRLAKAWLTPTPQNLQSYQEMQKDMLDRSQVFSTAWMQTIFEKPHLDHTLISPVNQQARHIQLDQEKHQVRQTIHTLKEEYGLFFFFSGNCPYCHQFAPIVKQFADQYGWQILAISRPSA